MKYIKLKHVLSALMGFLFTFQCLAQDPAASDANISNTDNSPPPVPFPGMATFQFRLNNNTGVATSSTAVEFTVSLTNLDFATLPFLASRDIGRVAGPGAGDTQFAWTYSPGAKTLTATLDGNFAGFAFNTFQINNLKVLGVSPMSNPTTGGAVKVTTATAVNTNISNDNTSVYTYTTSALLPVELLSFDASIQSNCEAKLVWTSAEESKFDYYQLEESTDGKNFNQLGNNQKSKGRNSKYEQIADLKAAKGSNVYYRLKMVDLDKSVHYSKTVGVQSDCSKKNGKILITPNPANNTIQVKELDSKGVMYIYDMTGRLVLTAAISEDGNQQINVADLTSGTYLIQVISNEGMFYSKLVKQ